MTGIISQEKAAHVFASMPAEVQIPSLCPNYVQVDSLRDRRLKPVFWLYEQSSFRCLRSFHVVVSTLQSGETVTDIESAYGYGGVVSSSQDYFLQAKAQECYFAWAKREGIVVEFCRIHPLLKSQHKFFLRQQYNRDVVTIHLSDDFFSGYRKKRRWTIRKELRKGVRLVCAKSIRETSLFSSLYMDTMKRALASDFYLFNHQYFEFLFQLDSVKLFIAFYENEPLSAAVVLENKNSGLAEYHLGAYARSTTHQPMETLLHLIADYYNQKNFKRFFLGGGRSRDSDDSLLAFKKGFSVDVAPFDIGYNILDPDKYDSLCQMSALSGISDRVIPYRH